LLAAKHPMLVIVDKNQTLQLQQRGREESFRKKIDEDGAKMREDKGQPSMRM
jgi:hypothetical protein